MTTDATPVDCEHEKTLITTDVDGEETIQCIICNDVDTITLDND